MFRVAVSVMLNVPWNAVYPTPGKYGGHHPVILAMMLPLFWLWLIYPKRRMREDYQMKRGSRIMLYVLASAMIIWPVWTQIAMAEEILVAQGVISGW